MCLIGINWNVCNGTICWDKLGHVGINWNVFNGTICWDKLGHVGINWNVFNWDKLECVQWYDMLG